MASVKTKQIIGPKNDSTPDKQLEDFIFDIHSKGGRVIDIKTEFYDHNQYVNNVRFQDNQRTSVKSWIRFTVYYQTKK